MIQRILARRYELQELIGGGGMADVYKAQDKLLDRAVAVKILHQNSWKNSVERLQQQPSWLIPILSISTMLGRMGEANTLLWNMYQALP